MLEPAARAGQRGAAPEEDGLSAPRTFAVRAFAILLTLILAAPVAAQPSPEAVRCFDQERVLPAGVYWADIGWYELDLDCPRPTFAVVSALSTRAPVLERAARAARATVVAPGYPWVVHARLSLIHI